jgi:hypothetical protein
LGILCLSGAELHGTGKITFYFPEIPSHNLIHYHLLSLYFSQNNLV